MFKSTIVSVLLFASTVFANPALYGTWQTQQANNGFMFTLNLTFAATSVTLTNTCAGYGKSLTAAVTVPVSYYNDQFVITQGAYNEQSAPDHSFNCNVQADPGSLNYQVFGSTLILTKPGYPDQLILQRR